MATQYLQLAPFKGLKTQNVSDRSREPGSMRGGSNVMVRDGEWWVRYGEDDFLADPTASAMFHWIVDIGTTLVLISEWQVIMVNQTNGQMTMLHAADGSAICTWANGSNNVSRTGALTGTFAADQLIGTGGGPTAVGEPYRITNVAGTVITIERPYTGSASINQLTATWNPLMTSASPFPDPPDDMRTGYVVFEQLVTHTAADMWATSPATTTNRKYLIITSENYGLMAYDLVSGAKVTDFFRNTAIASPTAPSGGFFCTRFGDILVIARAGDPNGNAAERTVWFSAPGDFVTWHTGLQGKGGTPNFLTMDGYEWGFDNPITGVEAFGNTMAIFRVMDTSICQKTGAPGVPLSAQRLASFGMPRPNLCANLGNAVAFVSRDGVYMLTGDGGIQSLNDGLSSLLETIDLRELSPVVRRVFYWQKYKRLCIVLGMQDTANQPADATPTATTVTVQMVGASQTYQSRQGVLIRDMESGEWWLEDRPTICGYGQGTKLSSQGNNAIDDFYAIRYSGAIVKLSGKTDDSAWNGKDEPEVSRSGTASLAANQVVNANVETPWFDLGSGMWKQLQRLVVIMRTFPNLNDLLSVGETAHVATINLYSDWDDDTVRETFDLTCARTDIFAGTEGQGLAEPKLFVLTPETGGHVFKLKITNALSAASTAAGYKQAHFRLSEIGVYFEPEESIRPLVGLTET